MIPPSVEIGSETAGVTQVGNLAPSGLTRENPQNHPKNTPTHAEIVLPLEIDDLGPQNGKISRPPPAAGPKIYPLELKFWPAPENKGGSLEKGGSLSIYSAD